MPFFVPTTYKVTLRSEACALSLVETRIGEAKASLMRDVSVKRVAVVSERPTKSSVTKDWIKNVFHADSVHCHDRSNSNKVTHLPVVAELGWGSVEQEDLAFTAVMVLHVIGDYTLLTPFITQFADVWVVDAGARACAYDAAPGKSPCTGAIRTTTKTMRTSTIRHTSCPFRSRVPCHRLTRASPSTF